MTNIDNLAKSPFFDALQWISEILIAKSIPFQVTGGLAARLYGATRELHDIDLDIPEDCFDKILPDVKPYIIFGPAHYQDEAFQVMLMTLDYQGIPIDVGGAYQTRVYDKSNSVWISAPADFSKLKIVNLHGLDIPVVAKSDLVEYKKALARDVDREDIRQLSLIG